MLNSQHQDHTIMQLIITGRPISLTKTWQCYAVSNYFTGQNLNDNFLRQTDSLVFTSDTCDNAHMLRTIPSDVYGLITVAGLQL